MSKKAVVKWTKADLDRKVEAKTLQGYTWPKKEREEKQTEPNGRIVTRLYPTSSPGKNSVIVQLLEWCNAKGLILHEEYRFHPTRKWRFDWVIESLKIAIEFEGSVINKNRGGHTSAEGYSANLEKYNEAAVIGWRVIRVDWQTYSTLTQALDTAYAHLKK